MVYYSIEGNVSNQLETFIVECLNDLVPVHPEHSVDILIRMRKKIEKSWLGTCSGDTEQITVHVATRYKGKKLGPGQIASTLAHELTHAKQFMLGEINMVDYTWRQGSEEIDCESLSYALVPWEVQANSEEERLVKTYWRY